MIDRGDGVAEDASDWLIQGDVDRENLRRNGLDQLEEEEDVEEEEDDKDDILRFREERLQSCGGTCDLMPQWDRRFDASMLEALDNSYQRYFTTIDDMSTDRVSQILTQMNDICMRNKFQTDKLELILKQFFTV